MPLTFDPKDIPDWYSVTVMLKVTTHDKNLMSILALFKKLGISQPDGKVVINDTDWTIEFQPNEVFFPPKD